MAPSRQPNGNFNVTEPGFVNDPAQFAALYAYSTTSAGVFAFRFDQLGRKNPDPAGKPGGPGRFFKVFCLQPGGLAFNSTESIDF
jgi:hypothetical protein